jgi:hypothetical protein
VSAESKGWRGGVAALQAGRPAREKWKAIMERESFLGVHVLVNRSTCGLGFHPF